MAGKEKGPHKECRGSIRYVPTGPASWLERFSPTTLASFLDEGRKVEQQLTNFERKGIGRRLDQALPPSIFVFRASNPGRESEKIRDEQWGYHKQ